MRGKLRKLKDLANTRQGYQFRKRVEKQPSGPIRIIQMADISDGCQVNWNFLPYVSEKDIRPEHFLKKGDIILCARGNENYSVLIDIDIKAVIAVSQFLVITVKGDVILPGYLAWYLKQPDPISYFKANASIGTVPLLNKKSVDNLTVPVPDLKKQKAISEAYSLWLKEKELTTQIIKLKDQLINAYMVKSLGA